MRMAVRRMRFAFAVVIALIALAVGFALFHRDEPSVLLKGSVILRDTYILSTCQLPNGKFCIWSYDFVSGGFTMHARREHLPQLLEGSTLACVVWEEAPEEAQSISVPWFILRAGDDSPKPLKLDGVKAFLEENGESGFMLSQADGESGKFFVSLTTVDEINPQPFAMFDSLTGEEIGRVPDTREFRPDVCFIGPNHEYFALSDVDISKVSRVRLFDAKTFTEIAGKSENLGSYGSTLTALGSNEFVAQSSSFDFVVFRVTLDGEHPAIVADKEFRYPEQPWKTSAIVGLKNTAGQILAGDVSPRWYNRYRDVRRSYYRKGLIAWESVRPPRLRIARANDPASCVDISLHTPGGREWPFQFSDDGTRLITRCAPGAFQILRVALPKISVEQECWLKYDATTDTLNLERKIPAPSP